MNVNLAYTCSGHPSGGSILYPVITRDRMTVLLRSLYGSSPAYVTKREVKLTVHSQLIIVGMHKNVITKLHIILLVLAF